MLIPDAATMSSFIELYHSIMNHVPTQLDKVYRHERVKDSFVILNEAIPLPTTDTVIAWRSLFKGWYPYPLIQLDNQAGIISAINPVVYGLEPESIQLPKQSIDTMYGAIARIPDQIGADEILPTVQILHMLATSGFHLLNLHPKYQSSLYPLVRIGGSECLIGLTFVYTNPDLVSSWLHRYNESLEEIEPKLKL